MASMLEEHANGKKPRVTRRASEKELAQGLPSTHA